ncbi:hypothetical protein IKP85_01925 [bacterium]|nr:hypothetical protein [bacterium]
MEHLFLKTQLAKRIYRDLTFNPEENSTDSTSKQENNKNSANTVSQNGSDNAKLGDKEVGIYGSLSDEIIENNVNAGFSNLGKDILSKMKDLIWDYKKKHPTTSSTDTTNTTDTSGSTDTTSSTDTTGSTDTTDTTGTTDTTDTTGSTDTTDTTGTTDTTDTTGSTDTTDTTGTTDTTDTTGSTDTTDTTGSTDSTDTTSSTDETETDDNPPKPETVDYTLIRKNTSENSKTINNIGSEGVSIKLENSADGKEYYYTFTSANGTAQSVQLEYLDNGRLVVIGSNLKIVASGQQDDSIILIGENNTVDTNSGNDQVRISMAMDSQTGFEISGYQPNGNVINTGSGNDYVFNFGLNKVNAGSGTDTVLLYGATIAAYGSTTSGWSGVETILSDREAAGTSDNKLGGACQDQFGDCKFLSFLNSLKYTLAKNNKSLSEYIQISGSGSNYTVKFVKSGESVTISASDLSDGAYTDGDIDNVLIEIAFRKILADPSKNYGHEYNIDNDETGSPIHDNYMLGCADNNWLISKHLFGQEKSAELMKSITYVDEYGNPTSTEDNTAVYKEAFKELMGAYLNGQISNLVLCCTKSNLQLGLCEGHAYCISGGVVGQYVSVTNPWDGNDSFQLDWNDFFDYFTSINLYGDAAQYAFNKRYDKLIYNEYDSTNDSVIYNFYSSTPNSNENYSGRIMPIRTSNTTNNTAETSFNPFANTSFTVNDEVNEITEEIQAIEDKIHNAKSIIKNTKSSLKLFS